jgi:thiol-disulfide isomerase/thioredoxin
MRRAALAAFLLVAPALAAPASEGVIADDYPRALASAREKGLPLLVDVWAPWCPSCRFMRAYVLGDARLADLSRRFVRLDLNTELPSAEGFVARYPIDAWPTLLFVDPTTEEAVLRWAGTATVDEVEKLAADAERALSARRAGRAEEALARADRLMASRRHAEAAAAYAEALAAGGPRWAERARAAEHRVQALSLTPDQAACARAAREVLPPLAPGPRRARVAGIALGCANGGGEAAAADRTALEEVARAALKDPGAQADDRSLLHEALVDARDAAGDDAGARGEARRWQALLEAEAARAPTPLARSAFDAARVAAGIRLGDPARALPAVRASVRELPGDFAPLSTLAYASLAAGRPAEALDAAQRALALAEGPRRVRVELLVAQAHLALGDRAAARAALEEGLRFGEALPEEQRPRSWLAQSRKLLDQLGGSDG